VYVGNISFHVFEKVVSDVFELIGPVRSLRLTADPGTSKRRGYTN
jgi:cleavage stimulation factor subunit 2